jgi:hypothetical protein
LSAKLKKKISQLEEVTNSNAEDDILIRKPGVSEISKKLQMDEEDSEDEKPTKKRSKTNEKSVDDSFDKQVT